EQGRRREAPRLRPGRRRFATEPERPGVGGQLPADVLSTGVDELVAPGPRVEPRRLEHPLPADAATGRRRVAGAALVLVEGRSEAFGGAEYPVEQLRPRLEARELGGSEARERGTGRAPRGLAASTRRGGDHRDQPALAACRPPLPAGRR